MRTIKIGDKTINENSPTFIIAEVGTNHENDMKRAKQMIREATEAGADAIKFQTFKAEIRSESGVFNSISPKEPST